MPCSCQKKADQKPSSYVVRLPNGTSKAYRTEVEAAAAAKRGGGTYKAA